MCQGPLTGGHTVILKYKPEKFYTMGRVMQNKLLLSLYIYMALYLHVIKTPLKSVCNAVPAVVQVHSSVFRGATLREGENTR